MRAAAVSLCAIPSTEAKRCGETHNPLEPQVTPARNAAGFLLQATAAVACASMLTCADTLPLNQPPPGRRHVDAKGCKGGVSSSGWLSKADLAFHVQWKFLHLWSPCNLSHCSINIHNLTDSYDLTHAEEEKHGEEKRKRGGWERVAMALGRPFTKQSSAVCRLHLKVQLEIGY